ncbi:MAG: bacteriohopanetetrol glucosamine biosynthesis glycosyltransferase HpnI [Bryobacteraceae bacterium]|nr:bacteriohopanetetrol glucosamine biosynthesis glycosyltransferase HpnI [Bryobacteraceae bacterium]
MMLYLLWAAAAATAGYHLVAAWAALRQWRRSPATPTNPGPVSILKPVRGLDPGFYDAIRGHARQVYAPGFELLFGVADPADPAIAEIERLQAEFPHLRIACIRVTHRAPNGKVAALVELGREARHPLWLVNDSDIAVEPGYLNQVTAPLADPAVGVVTCLYRADSRGAAGRWEALGIAIDFAAGVLVAPLVGIKEFGLGATLVFRADDLARIGGFARLETYLADDYQLARHITQLGKRVELSPTVVETTLGEDTWRGIIKHQVRWARTIRVSRGDGYWGLPVTHAGLWMVILLLSGQWAAAALVLLARWASAFATGVLVLRSQVARAGFWLAPLWDCFAFGIWLAGARFNTVEWRGQRLELRPDGTMKPNDEAK